MPVTTSSTGLTGWFSSIFKPKDPMKREITQSLGILDRMMRALESSKKSLEVAIDEHKRRANMYSDDQEMRRILEEEIKNIHGYMSVINKALYDLARVKYRLETLFYVEEPLKELPAIVEELKAVEPVIEQINPQLLNNIKVLEQKVTSILTMSSPYIPGLTPKTVEEQRVGQSIEYKTSSSAENTLEQLRSKKPQRTMQKEESTAPSSREESEVINKSRQASTSGESRREDSIKAPAIATTTSTTEGAGRDSQAVVYANIPLHIVEEWVLQELKINSGVLDLRVFEAKYGVSKKLILEALNSLESKNLIRIRRKQ
jgi:hypothetical protein